jgi:enoyl-CoA hydratase/carnithine racemase
MSSPESPQSPQSPQSRDDAEPEVVLERRGSVLIVRINRPAARNALNTAVMSGIGTALMAADADPDIRAVVLTGTGDRAFCAGMDLRAFAAGQIAPTEEQLRGLEVFGRFASGSGGCDKPVICAAQATAVAGGLEVVLACDLAVVAEDAKLGLPEAKRGLFAAGGGMYLARRIPLAKALEMTMTGDPITPAEALALGLINAVAPPGEVLDRALELAGRITENGPLGVQASKRLVRMAAFEPLADVRKVHAELQQSVFASEDAKEGAVAFVERRPPVWSGR